MARNQFRNSASHSLMTTVRLEPVTGTVFDADEALRASAASVALPRRITCTLLKTVLEAVCPPLSTIAMMPI